MAASKGVFDSAQLSVAISTACSLLNVEKFYPDQEQALRNFFKGKDLFFSAHTGYGKSLIFQAIPIIADVLNEQVIGTSTVLVISPLLSLMKDQVKHVNDSFGISAAAIFDNQDEDVLKAIEEGVYSLVYATPECFVGKKRWRTLASSQTFREDCIAVVIDEAHCLVHWGTSTQKESPFRKWYANVVELKSLLHSSTRYAVFTATATKATKSIIYQMLNLNVYSTFEIEKPPLRGNISYQFVHLSKDKPLETVFGTLIEKLKAKGITTERCIVFCKTRKQCSIVYRLFTAALGEKNFIDSSLSYDRCLVQMFHAGSPDSVKVHVVNEMTKDHSHLRLLICTVAFGMGIDCKDVYSSIHFGPSSTVESLIQETGRLGRDGKQCICYVLYNGLLTSHCDNQIKQLVETKNCRQNHISNLFQTNSTMSYPTGCLCCDHCSKNCDCSEHENISMISFGETATEPNDRSFSIKRYTSKDQRALLRQKLLDYRASLIPATTEQFLPVGSTGILFEFDHYQIEQVLANCDHLCSMDDIISCVELWRNTHANMVYTILNEVFQDMNGDVLFSLSEEDFEDMEVVQEDWEEIRDDTGRAELFGDSKFDDLSNITEENSLNQSVGFDNDNVSFILNHITKDIENMEHD
ncbi:uncharacterized protein LOC114536425 [Dendronephthya gigantea]|uniref:uncharacterized protein LOC114536425 n=1 Tax=Dendronephthya gigantea TaxID=151771 RepID=UPI00106D09E4|nr:uncharacterized protein LOC114536425 [Dendronephthya gigantea]